VIAGSGYVKISEWFRLALIMTIPVIIIWTTIGGAWMFLTGEWNRDRHVPNVRRRKAHPYNDETREATGSAFNRHNFVTIAHPGGDGWPHASLVPRHGRWCEGALGATRAQRRTGTRARRVVRVRYSDESTRSFVEVDHPELDGERSALAECEATVPA